MGIRLEAQLDGSLRESVDCGPAGVVMILDYASGGLIRTTTERVRRKMQDQDATNPDDWVRAIEGFSGEFAKHGLKPPTVVRVNSREMSQLWTQLYEKQRPSLMVIDYGVVKDEGHWWWSSSSFTGLHCVLYRRARIRQNGDYQVLVFDPLADGRVVNGRRMRKGPNWWPWRLARRAARAAPPAGDWQGVIVWQAVPLAAPEPEPEEPEPAPSEEELMGQAIMDAWDHLEAARDQLSQAQEELRAYVPADSDSDSDGEQGVKP